MHGGVPKELLDCMCRDRRDELIALTKEKLASISRTIEATALMKLPGTVRRQWPYGLPPNWDLGLEHIWSCILKFVDAPQDIINASETCVLFRSLLQGKYRAARLAEAVEVCVDKRKWMLPSKTLLDLRRVSHASKNYVDQSVMRGRLHELYGYLEFLVPSISLGLNARRIAQPRLDKILSSLDGLNVPPGMFSVREVCLKEEAGFDLLPLRGAVQRLFELVGKSIQSLVYISEQDSCNTYNTLRRWVSLLPNLEEINVVIRTREYLDIIKPYEPFPTVPHLKRFQEINETETNYSGLALSHVCEILEKNPTLLLVRLSPIPENRINSIMAAGILDQHRLERFSITSFSSLMPFFGRQINWPLTKLTITHIRSGEIPAETFFNFINQFGSTLNELTAFVLLENQCTCEAGKVAMMNLPKLTRLIWRLETDSQCLRFMISLKKLEYLAIYIPRGNKLGAKETKEHLEAFHIPKLYPAMRRIQVRKDYGGPDWQLIWESGNVAL